MYKNRPRLEGERDPSNGRFALAELAEIKTGNVSEEGGSDKVMRENFSE